MYSELITKRTHLSDFTTVLVLDMMNTGASQKAAAVCFFSCLPAGLVKIVR